LFSALIIFAMPVAGTLAAMLVSSSATAQTAASIQVEGNRRVEVDTIRSYFKPGPGGRLDQGRIDDGLKALIETGLFQDVRINQAGGRLVVTVVDGDRRIVFEDNKKVKDRAREIGQTAERCRARWCGQRPAHREIIADPAAMTCVTPKSSSSRTPRRSVSTVARRETGVKSIEFIGNVAYSSYRLKDVIKTRESNLLSFLGGNDVYDPDRVEADRDLIRRFYLKHGYADVQVIAALTEYDPERKGFLVTFKIEEGQQYRVAQVNFASSIGTLDGNTMRGFSRVNVGSLYNAEALEKSVEEMQIEASRRGYAFAIVRPRGDRNFEAHTVSITFTIDEGPRTYIERINVRGNTRTRDYVIRREFDLSEGDAYNRALVDRAERRLKNLDFFKTVKITASRVLKHRVILVVDLERSRPATSRCRRVIRRPTALRAAFPSTLLGRGLFAKASVTMVSTPAVTLSFVDPYLLDYRVARARPVQREQLANSYISYGTKTIGFSPRLLRVARIFPLQVRYSIYQQNISPSTLSNCNNDLTVELQSQPGLFGQREPRQRLQYLVAGPLRRR
jgi:outer membrane protein insertion porin family